MFTLDHFPDAAPRFPDRIAVQAPRGTRERLRRAAEAEHLTVPDLIRRAIERAASEALAGQPARREA